MGDLYVHELLPGGIVNVLEAVLESGGICYFSRAVLTRDLHFVLLLWRTDSTPHDDVAIIPLKKSTTIYIPVSYYS